VYRVYVLTVYLLLTGFSLSWLIVLALLLDKGGLRLYETNLAILVAEITVAVVGTGIGLQGLIRAALDVGRR